MDESNTEPLSPLKPIPFEEVLNSLGITNSKWSTQKKKECASPLELVPLQDVIERAQRAMNTNLLQRSKKKSLASRKEQKPITFKVPKRLSVSKNNQKVISSKSSGNTSINTNSVKRETKRFTSISNNIDNVRTTSVSHVRKELFSAAATSTVSSTKPRKYSLIPAMHLIGVKQNSSKKSKIIEQGKSSASLKKESSVPPKKEALLKLSTSSIDDFELAETFCNLQSPPAAGLMKEFQYMKDLQTKLHALSLQMGTLTAEMNTVWQRISSGMAAACAKANGKRMNEEGLRMKSPLSKVASAKRVNLLKSTLLKTVREMPSFEAAATTSDGDDKKEPVDAKMTQSISMYNAMRGHILQTPKVSRKSLEKGDSISTTVQKQCLMLMDTPQNDRKQKY